MWNTAVETSSYMIESQTWWYLPPYCFGKSLGQLLLLNRDFLLNQCINFMEADQDYLIGQILFWGHIDCMQRPDRSVPYCLHRAYCLLKELWFIIRRNCANHEIVLQFDDECQIRSPKCFKISSHTSQVPFVPISTPPWICKRETWCTVITIDQLDFSCLLWRL